MPLASGVFPAGSGTRTCGWLTSLGRAVLAFRELILASGCGEGTGCGATLSAAVLQAGALEGRDIHVLAEALSDAAVPDVSDDCCNGNFDRSEVVAASGCCEGAGCGATLSAAVLQAAGLEGRDIHALAEEPSDAVVPGTSDLGAVGRDDLDGSGAAVGSDCCGSTGCGARVAAPWTFGSALPADTGGCSPSASRGGVAFWIPVPVDGCAASNAGAFDGGTAAADSVAGAAASAAGVEKLAVASVAASPVCASGRSNDGAELSQNAGAGTDAGASEGTADAAGSLGTGSVVSASPASPALVAAGFAGLENCSSGCPNDGAELIQSDACELSSLSGAALSGAAVSGNGVSGEDVSGEDVSGEDVSGEDVSDEDVLGEDVSDENGSDDAGSDGGVDLLDGPVSG